MSYPKYEISGTLVSAVVADDKNREYLASATASSEEVSDVATAMTTALASANDLMASELAAESSQAEESAQ